MGGWSVGLLFINQSRNTPAGLQAVGVVDDMRDVMLLADLSHKNLTEQQNRVSPSLLPGGGWINVAVRGGRTTSLGTRGEKHDVVVATHSTLDAPLHQRVREVEVTRLTQSVTDNRGSGPGIRARGWYIPRHVRERVQVSSNARISIWTSFGAKMVTRATAPFFNGLFDGGLISLQFISNLNILDHDRGETSCEYCLHHNVGT